MAEQLRPMEVILRRLPLENQNPVSAREKIANTLITPLGLAWVAVIIPLLLVLETSCVSLCIPVVIVMFMVELCQDFSGEFSDLFMRSCVLVTLICMGVVCVLYGILVFMMQILLLMHIAMAFCLDVFRCKRRWQDAFPYMTRRIVLESLYILVID